MKVNCKGMSPEKAIRILRRKMENDGFKDRWYVTEDVCKLLNVSRRTLQTMRDNKIIAYKKTGRKIYYKASDIEAYLESING